MKYADILFKMEKKLKLSSLVIHPFINSFSSYFIIYNYYRQKKYKKLLIN